MKKPKKRIGKAIFEILNPINWFDKVPLSLALPKPPTEREEQALLNELIKEREKTDGEFLRMLTSSGELAERSGKWQTSKR